MTDDSLEEFANKMTEKAKMVSNTCIFSCSQAQLLSQTVTVSV